MTPSSHVKVYVLKLLTATFPFQRKLMQTHKNSDRDVQKKQTEHQ